MLFLDSLSFVSKFSQLLEVSQTAQNLRDTWHVSRNTFATCIRFLSFLFMLCLLSSRNSIVVPVKRVQGIIVKGRAVVHFIQERFRETSIMHRKIPLGINGNLLNHKTASLLTDTVCKIIILIKWKIITTLHIVPWCLKFFPILSIFFIEIEY